MKLVDSSVTSETDEFIFNPFNVVVTTTSCFLL